MAQQARKQAWHTRQATGSVVFIQYLSFHSWTKVKALEDDPLLWLLDVPTRAVLKSSAMTAMLLDFHTGSAVAAALRP